jgi:acyl-CoA synthetase (AMP-forming)/AMP-acid ligase II
MTRGEAKKVPAAGFTTIYDLLAEHASRLGDVEALIDGPRRVRYAELAQRVDRLAGALLAFGIRRGDRIATLGPPAAAFFEIYLATVSIGAIWQGLNPRYQARELETIIKDARPQIVFVHSPFDGRDYERELKQLDCQVEKIIVYVSDATLDLTQHLPSAVSSEILARARRAVEPSDTAVIVYTSGTTGRPKGAMLSHRAILTSALANQVWGGAALDRTLCTLPINHVGALNNTCMPVFAHGGAIVFYPKFDIARMAELGTRERITYLVASPTILMLLQAQPDGLTLLATPRLIVFGGAKTPRNVLQPIASLGPQFQTVYGQTETCGIVSISDPDSDLDVLSGTIGKPLPGMQIRVWSASGQAAEENEHGELQVKGEQLMSCYFERPTETADAFTTDGYFRTGDMGYQRADGCFIFVGRLKEMFKSGEYNISPSEIEQAICEHPSVAAAAVLPVPHALFQEVSHAFVAAFPGRHVDSKELDSFLRSRLANYKVPKSYTFEAELPQLPNTKIDKQALRRKLDAAQPKQSN